MNKSNNRFVFFTKDHRPNKKNLSLKTPKLPTSHFVPVAMVSPF